MKLLVAFAKAPSTHWIPRLQAGGVDAEGFDAPTVDAEGVVQGLPAPQDGVVILVNARVAGAMVGSGRNDLYSLPQGAPQDGSPVGLDFLVKV